jgi:hypothetical protein
MAGRSQRDPRFLSALTRDAMTALANFPVVPGGDAALNSSHSFTGVDCQLRGEGPLICWPCFATSDVGSQVRIFVQYA